MYSKYSTRNLSAIVDFKLLELRLKYDEKLYDFVPTHPAWDSPRKKIAKTKKE